MTPTTLRTRARHSSCAFTILALSIAALAAGGLALVAPAAVFAQDAPQDAPAADDGEMKEEGEEKAKSKSKSKAKSKKKAKAKSDKSKKAKEKADAGPLPTTAEMQQLYDDGQYAEALKKLGRVTSLRGAAAKDYDRYELLMLKGEAHLRLKASAPAIQAFTEAAKATKDPEQASVARATAALLRKTKDLAYKPKGGEEGGDAEPIDVLDPAGRQAAFEAMLADELDPVKAKAQKALDGSALPPIAEAIKGLKGLRDLEAAAGGGGEVQDLILELGDHGRGLLEKALDKMSERVDEIKTSANELIDYRVTVPLPNGGFREEVRQAKRGLDTDDNKDLKTIIQYCKQIPANAQGLAVAMGGSKKDAEDVVEKAKDVAKRAEKVLKATY